MSTASFVQVNVGGFPYSIAVSDIEKFPGSFFECMIKKEWLHDSVGAISIQRDGALFKFVNAYLVNGQLPRDKEGLISLDDFTLDGLKEEADFYGLDALSKECNTQHRKSSGLDIGSYLTIRKYIAGSAHRTGSIEVDYFSNLTQSLKCVWSHFCVRGKMKPYPYLHSRPLYKSTSVRNVNVEELIATATQSPFGRGTETVVDTAVRNSFEIDACLLDASALKAVAGQIECKALAPHLILTFRPYKLVIYKEDGHFDDHRDTVRGDGHIGTLVVILNSEYTGGELQVMHGGRTEVVTGPYNWVAMYGDCLHKINPVTSGTRVSLIYDIYASKDETSVANQDKNFKPFSVREEEKKRMLWESLDKELSNYDSIIICLEHLYPECQTNPSFLKGGDRALYERLQENEAFDVEVVAATIYRHDDNRTDPDKTSNCALFSPTIVQRAMGILPYKPFVEEKTKLVMSGKLSDDKLLDYSPYISQTGNDAQDGYSFYIVAGLQVRRKKG